MIDCPALHRQSEHYPERFKGRVPKRVRMTRTVTADLFPGLAMSLRGEPINTAIKDMEYPCWTNSHGAVAVQFLDGTRLGVKPDEFEIVEWYGATHDAT